MKLLSLLIFCSLFFSTSFAETKKPIFITIVYNEFPPFEYTIDGNATGITINRVKKIAKNVGVVVEFVPAPWSRALKMAKQGEADGILSLYKTNEREEFLYYPSKYIIKTRDVAISLASNKKINLTKMDDLKKYSIGVIKDNSHGAEFDNLILTKDFSSTSDIKLVEKLLQKRFDVGIFSLKSFLHFVTHSDYDITKFKIHPLTITEGKLNVAFSRKSKKGKKVATLFSEYLDAERK